MIILFENFEIYMYMVLNKKNVQTMFLNKFFMVVKRPCCIFSILLSVTGTVLQYFVSHHFTECSKGDPRAHHEEVEVLRAPNGLRFLNSV